ncbi:dUTP diphosphatase [Spiroplasma helicoides]|uniref:dUTP diphosphatase n=1 Tax=Spiroplasma helicoides TaxID=216938 RepID=A0A1B3SL75_9MOLU|nr:dUTP diphosphatase [Spiroplasma helicoides]AOG60684.1 dUTP diphosphatase [Spiroplasma helicoides]
MINITNIKNLIEKQKKLDANIESTHNIPQNEETLSKKIVALFVEFGEFINEQREFKFWSNKKASEKDVLLEEYVDGIHFILSIGYTIGFNPDSYKFDLKNKSIIDIYLECYEKLAIFNKNRSIENYINLLNSFFSVASILNFSEEDILDAYDKKNKINFKRIEEKY